MAGPEKQNKETVQAPSSRDRGAISGPKRTQARISSPAGLLPCLALGVRTVFYTQAYRQQNHPLFLLLMGGPQVAGVSKCLSPLARECGGVLSP